MLYFCTDNQTAADQVLKVAETPRGLREANREVSLDAGENAIERLKNMAGKVRAVACEILGTTTPNKRFIDKEVWWWKEEVQKATRKKKRLSAFGGDPKTMMTASDTRKRSRRRRDL